MLSLSCFLLILLFSLWGKLLYTENTIMATVDSSSTKRIWSRGEETWELGHLYMNLGEWDMSHPCLEGIHLESLITLGLQESPAFPLGSWEKSPSVSRAPKLWLINHLSPLSSPQMSWNSIVSLLGKGLLFLRKLKYRDAEPVIPIFLCGVWELSLTMWCVKYLKYLREFGIFANLINWTWVFDFSLVILS